MESPPSEGRRKVLVFKVSGEVGHPGMQKGVERMDTDNHWEVGVWLPAMYLNVQLRGFATFTGMRQAC
jgi:hypothetical protein